MWEGMEGGRGTNGILKRTAQPTLGRAPYQEMTDTSHCFAQSESLKHHRVSFAKGVYPIYKRLNYFPEI